MPCKPKDKDMKLRTNLKKKKIYVHILAMHAFQCITPLTEEKHTKLHYNTNEAKFLKVYKSIMFMFRFFKNIRLLNSLKACERKQFQKQDTYVKKIIS